MNYKIADFRFSNPSETKNPKAVLILVPPSNSDGRDMIKYAEWIEFAVERELILCGCFFQDVIPSGIEEYCHMASGSGIALMANWQEYALKEGFSVDTPFLMWGFSAGGQFNYEFACNYPARVMGFVVNKGGIYYTGLAKPSARKVPALFITGEKDAMWRRAIVAGLVALNRACGADWDLHEEPGVYHGEGDSAKLGRELFAALLEKA